MKGLKKLSLLVAIVTMTFAVTIAAEANKADKNSKEVKAEEKGIQFTEAKWAKILKKAKAENKIIFFDADTTWCGPCKMMQKNVFTRDDVAAVFNKDFINVKYDMESGEGLKLAGKYPLEAYPTLFFIDAKGKVVKQVIGYQTPEKLIDLAKSVQKKSPKAI